METTKPGFLRQSLLQLTWTIAALALFVSSANSVSAQQQPLLPFQGQLTTQDGTPLNPATPVTVVFRVYQNPVGGAALWEESHPNIVVIAGRFSVLLGSRTSFPAKIFQNVIHLGITVDDGNSATADVEMRPRQTIVPTVFATNAGDSEKLSGHDWRDLLVTGNDPSVGLIRASKIEPKLLEQLEKRVLELEQSLQRLNQDFRREQPVGTIISSYLNWQEFSAATENNVADPNHGNWSAVHAKWAPADGRKIVGSKFATATGQQSVPDLRGVFLRGLNSFDPGETSPAEAARRDPENRSRGNFQPAAFGRHDHGGGDHSHNTGLWNGVSPVFGGVVFRTELDGDPKNGSVKATTNSGKIITLEGGDETRPKNVAIFYYVRIN